MKRAALITLFGILLIQTPVLAEPANTQRYKEFADKKTAVDDEIAAEVARMEADFQTQSAPLVQKETETKAAIDLARQQYDKMNKADFDNQVINWILGAVKNKVAIPFFYLTIILAILYLVFLKRSLFLRFKILIAVLTGLLLVFYSVDLFAQERVPQTHQAIDEKITTVGRLLNAGDIDKAIVAIEETSASYIEMSLPEVTSTWLVPVETFRKGSFLEKYTLGCLYYETKNFTKTSALFMDAIANLRPGRGELPQVMNMLQFFEEQKQSQNALTALMTASAISLEQGNLLAHLDTIGVGPDQVVEARTVIINRMRTAVDYLKAAVYLAAHSMPAEASIMYNKAVATARDSAGYLGLAEYAYNNGMENDAVVAMTKAFKAARSTESLIAYTRLARKHQIPDAATAWDKAVASARNVKDFVLVARYLKEQGSNAEATMYLKQSVDKQGSVEDLLDVLNLAGEMNDAVLVAQMVDSVMGRTRRFQDLMKIAEVCGKVAEGKLAEVFNAAAGAAIKLAHFKALVNFVASAKDKTLIGVVAQNARTRLVYVRDLQNLRNELMDKGFKDVVSPINQAIVSKTRSRNELMTLFRLFESEGFKQDAEAALARMVAVSGSASVAESVLPLALEREYFGAAFDACIFLYPRKHGNTVPDPKLVQESSFVPNGPEVEWGVYCAIIGYRAGRTAEALEVVEGNVLAYLTSYVDANISDPEANLNGPVNTYFYLRLLWELTGTTNLIPKFEAVYAAVEARYLEEYKAEKSGAISDKQLEIENRKIALNENVATLESELSELNGLIEQLRLESRKQLFKTIAAGARILATVMLFIIAIVIAVIAGLRFSRNLTRFRISGFTFKFLETFGFELMFSIILIPIGLLMLIGAQTSQMLLHIQQDLEPDGLFERLEDEQKKSGQA